MTSERGTTDPRTARRGITFGELVRRAFTTYRSNFWRLIRVFIPVQVAYGIPVVALAYQIGIYEESDLAQFGFAAFIFTEAGLSAVINSVLIVVAALIVGPTETSPIEAINPTKPLARNVLAAALLVAMISLLPLAGGPAIALFFLLLVRPLLGPPVIGHTIAFERRTLYEAWQRAKQLLAGRWMRSYMHLLTLSLGLGLVSTLLTVIGVAPLGEVPEKDPLWWLLGNVFVIRVVEGLTLPLLAMGMYELYRELVATESEH